MCKLTTVKFQHCGCVIKHYTTLCDPFINQGLPYAGSNCANWTCETVTLEDERGVVPCECSKESHVKLSDEGEKYDQDEIDAISYMVLEREEENKNRESKLDGYWRDCNNKYAHASMADSERTMVYRESVYTTENNGRIRERFDGERAAFPEQEEETRSGGQFRIIEMARGIARKVAGRGFDGIEKTEQGNRRDTRIGYVVKEEGIIEKMAKRGRDMWEDFCSFCGLKRRPFRSAGKKEKRPVYDASLFQNMNELGYRFAMDGTWEKIDEHGNWVPYGRAIIGCGKDVEARLLRTTS